MEKFKQKFIDTAYSKFGIKANGSINFEQAFAIIDEIQQCNIANVVVPKGTLCPTCGEDESIEDWQTYYRCKMCDTKF